MKSINILKLIEEEEEMGFMTLPNLAPDDPSWYEYICSFYDDYIEPILKEKNIPITDDLIEIFCNTLDEIQFGDFDKIKLPYKYHSIIFQTNKERKKEFANMISEYILIKQHLIDNK